MTTRRSGSADSTSKPTAKPRARKSTPAGRKTRSSATRGTATAKTAPAKSASSKAKATTPKVAAAAAATPTPTPAEPATPASTEPDARFKRPDLIEAVAERWS